MCGLIKEVSKMFGFRRKDRDYFLSKGEKLIERELESEASYMVKVQEQIELKNSEVLSSSIENSDTIPKKVKKFVAQNQENMRKVIMGIAIAAEENEYKSVDEAFRKIRFSKIDRQKTERLFDSQKKLTLSFNSLKLTIDIFLRINEMIKQEIQVSRRKNPESYTRNLLKNSILVYELTRFVIKCIEDFELEGITDLEGIRSEMLEEIENNRQKEIQQQMNLKQPNTNVSKNTQEIAIKASEDRLKILALIEKKWDDFMRKVKAVQNSIPDIKNLVPDLKVIQSNAERQIDILQLIATMQVLESNLNLLQGITSIREIELAPLTPQDACFLLGLENVEGIDLPSLPVPLASEENAP